MFLQPVLQVVSNVQTPFEWLTSHIQLVGWPLIVFIAWKASKVFTDIKHAITRTFGQIDTMATNHFPHMEASLLKQDNILASQTTLLTSVDSSLKHLVGAAFKPVDKTHVTVIDLESGK